MNKEQLPAEAVARVDNEAKKFAFYNYVAEALHPEAVFDNMGTWPEQARVCYYSILHYMTRPDICWPYTEPTLAAEYATKLYQAEQEIAQLKRWKMEATELLTPINAYVHKHIEKSLGQSCVKLVLDRCKHFEQARTLLGKFISRHEAGLLPDRFIYDEIKTFLDGTK